MALLGHITPEVINIFLSESADLLGQWDEACFSLENGGDSREALLWISRTVQSLRRAARGIGLEEFLRTLNATDEYVRLVLRTAAKPGAEVATTLSHIQISLSGWIVGLRTDADYRQDLSELNDEIRVQRSAVEQILEEERKVAEAAFSTQDEGTTLSVVPDIAHSPAALEEKKALENATWNVFSDGERKIDELIALVARLSTRQAALEHVLKGQQVSTQDLRRMAFTSEGLVSQLCEMSVGLKFVQLAQLFERIGQFAVESAQVKGCAVQFEFSGQSVQIDKSLQSALWDPLTRIVRWMVENSFESPEDRVKAGKLPMGSIHLSAEGNVSLVKLVLEDDGRGQGDVETNQAANSTVSFLNAARTALRRISSSMLVHSTAGKTTRIEITVPASPRLLDLVFLSCNENTYAVPAHTVDEIIEPGTFSTHILRGDKQLIEFNGRLYPFVTLIELLEKSPVTRRRVQASVAIEKGNVLLVRYGTDVIAVGCDSVLSRKTTLVTPLPPHLSDVRGLLATLLSGSGEPIFIVDLLEISEAFLGSRREREVA